MKIQDKLALAQNDFDAAQATLEQLRQGYEQGSGKAYAALLARQADLRAKIASHEAAAEDATAEFKRRLSAADYEKTKPVKEALLRKNDALAIADELRIALLDSERAALAPAVQASSDARAYASAHDRAYTAYAHLQAYRAMADCEESLSRAIALVSHARDLIGLDEMSGDAPAHRIGFIWRELQAMALLRPEAGQRPYIPELGDMDLGAFAHRQFLSPVQVIQLRRAAALQEEVQA